MTMLYSHLSSAAAEKIDLPDALRIEHIQKPRWIGYTRAQEILDKLDDLLKYPKQHRMPNMLLVGESNNGKTLLIDHFIQQNPARENIGGDTITVPVLSVQAPPGPDERGLYNAMLEKLFERIKPSESTDQKRGRLVGVLKQVNLGMIIIDEIHHLLAGSLIKQRNFLNVLKYLSNELCVPIVGVGTVDAVRAIQVDPQIQNRFVPEVIPRWALNKDFARLLASFERVLPLREPSHLNSREMASRLLAMTGGTIGELSMLLEAAAIYAIKTKLEVIDVNTLEKCDYTSPSERKASISAL